MELYEVSKSGKSVTKYSLQAGERMQQYKESQNSRIGLYQFETTDYALLNKVRNCNEISLFEVNSDTKVDAHSRLGQLSMEGVSSYSELKRFSTLYYYSLSERISLEKVWRQYLNGNHQDFNLLHIRLCQENIKGEYCNHLLVPNTYEEVSPFDSTGGGYILSVLPKEICSVYSIKNILDLPEELAAIELLEQGRYQELEELSLPLNPQLLSYYYVVASEQHKIQELQQESMSQVADTLDIQKSLLKSIRQSGTWKLSKK